MKELFTRINTFVFEYLNKRFQFEELTDDDWASVILSYKRKAPATPAAKAVIKKLKHTVILSDNIFVNCLVLINFDMERFSNILQLVNMKYKIKFDDLYFNSCMYMQIVNRVEFLSDTYISDIYGFKLEDYFTTHIGRHLLFLKVNYLIKNGKNIPWEMDYLISVFDLAFCSKQITKDNVKYFCIHNNENSYEYEMKYFMHIQEKMKVLASYLMSICEADILNMKKRVTLTHALIYIKFIKYVKRCDDKCIQRIFRILKKQRYGLILNLQTILPYVTPQRKQEIEQLITKKSAQRLLNDLH